MRWTLHSVVKNISSSEGLYERSTLQMSVKRASAFSPAISIQNSLHNGHFSLYTLFSAQSEAAALIYRCLFTDQSGPGYWTRDGRLLISIRTISQSWLLGRSTCLCVWNRIQIKTRTFSSAFNCTLGLLESFRSIKQVHEVTSQLVNKWCPGLCQKHSSWPLYPCEMTLTEHSHESW